MKKNKLVNYTIASYREDYKGKSFKDLKDLLTKNKIYGNYICLLGTAPNRQIVFSRTKGYLYSDHVNQYKKLPRKFIYIEATDKDYLLISILNGKVFFESMIATPDELFKQIDVILNLNAEPLILNINAPKQQEIFAEKLAEVNNIDLNFLAKPLSQVLTPNKSYLTFDPLLQKRLKFYQGIGVLLVVAAIGAGFAYNHYQQVKQRQELLEAQEMAAKQVDHYVDYKNEFRQNSATLILNNLTQDYKTLAPALQSGWSVNNITYKNNALTFLLSSKNSNTLLASLNALIAQQSGVNMQYDKSFNHGKVSISFPMSKETPAIPTIIVPIKPQLVNFTDHLSLNFQKAITYSQNSFSNHGVYNSADLSINLNKISLVSLSSFLMNIDQYPAKIQSLTINPNNNLSNLTFSINSIIQFYGSK